MILIDTSALIGFLKGDQTPAARETASVVREQRPFSLCGIVVQEVLQGARDRREWRSLERYLLTQDMLEAENLMQAHVQAAAIYFDCRRRGDTPRSTVDCLIAQIALEHGATLLHDDRDFEIIARVRNLNLLPCERKNE